MFILGSVLLSLFRRGPVMHDIVGVTQISRSFVLSVVCFGIFRGELRRDRPMCVLPAFFAALRHVFFYWKNTDIALRSCVQYQGFIQSDIAWRCAPPPFDFWPPPFKIDSAPLHWTSVSSRLLQTAKDLAPTRAAVRHTRFPDDARGLYSQHDT